MTPAQALAYAEEITTTAVSEPQFRNAAGRLYYAVYWYLLAHPVCKDFNRNQDNVHKRLIEHLKGLPDPSLHRMAIRCLAPLRAIRNEADYVPELDFRRDLADEAADLTAEIVHDYLPT